VVPEDGEPVESLVAYVVPATDHGGPDIWRAHLRRWLAESMLPSGFVTFSVCRAMPDTA
jgi:hypothetical protein